MNIAAKLLPAFSVLAGLVIILAILTPGWFGLHIKSRETDMTVSMNVFYLVICANGEVMCRIGSVIEAVGQFKFGTEERTVEAVGCLIGVVIGGIMTLVFATCVKRQEITLSKQVAITALIFKIIGGICGGILSTEFIIVNVNFDDDDVEPVKLVKSIPYSLIVIGIGLLLELFAIIIHIATLRASCRQLPECDRVIGLSDYGPATVNAQSTSTTSSTSYTLLA